MRIGGRWQSQKALTLIETTIAMVVFLAGVFVAFTYFSNGQILLKAAKHRRIGLEIAQSRIEELRTVAFDDLYDHEEDDTEVDIGGITGKRLSLIHI